MKKILKSILLTSCLCWVLFITFGCSLQEDISDSKTEHMHSLVCYETKEPTCAEDGTIKFWYCNGCGTYFSNEEGTELVNEEDLSISQKDHTDENEDYLCDYGCCKVLIAKETLQQIINDTMCMKKVTVSEMYIPSSKSTTYYFDDNLLYVNVNNGQQENYYYRDEGITHLLIKSNEWSKEISLEEITYNISYLLAEKFNLEIASEFSIYNCNYGFFEGKKMFTYTNSNGIFVDVKLNDDFTLLEGIYIHEENNNIIYMFEMVYGENEDIINNLEDINNYIDGYKYDETTNTYRVYSSQGILDAFDNAEISGTVENPATIVLMKDIELKATKDKYGSAKYGILIESGKITLDLNGYCLSAPDYIDSVIQIGVEWGELCEAVLTIEDNSIDESGKIFASYIGIYNQGGTLVFNNGTIEINSPKGDWVAIGINQYLGSFTMNSGSIIVNSVATGWLTSGIGEDGPGRNVTINGGYINVNGPVASALYLRSNSYINGGTIECNDDHIGGTETIYLGTNEEGIGATFIGGIRSHLTINSLLAEGIGYYDANGNLIEVSDDATEVLDKGDIIVKRIN